MRDILLHPRDQVAPIVTVSSLRGLRVALVVNSVAMGGVEEHVRQVAAGLVERGARVTTVVPEDSAIDPLARAAARGRRLASARLTLASGMLRPAGLRRLFRLVRLLRRSKTDVMHLHLVGFGGGRWVLLAAVLAGVPSVVCTIHVAPQERQTVEGPARPGAASPGPSIGTSRCRGRHAIGWSRTLACRRPAWRSCRTRSSSSGSRRPVEPARSAVRQQWGIPPDAPVLGVLARLSPQKGLTYLVSALPAILDQHPDAYALVVGEGELRAEPGGAGAVARHRPAHPLCGLSPERRRLLAGHGPVRAAVAL